MKNPYPSLLNVYSGSLLVILITCVLVGGADLYEGRLFPGLILFIFGVLMLQGFKMPKEAQPKKVWLITFLGQMTDVKVDQLTLLLDWIPNFKIIGYQEFPLQQIDKNVKLTKPIICKDGQYIEGFISMSIVADDQDDDPKFRDKNNKWKSGGQKLQDFGNIGGRIEDAYNQLDDIMTVWIQEIALSYDSVEMEANRSANGKICISEELLKFVTGEVDKPSRPSSGNSSLDNTRDLGIKIKKMQPVFRPSDDIIEARNMDQIQLAKRKSQKTNTETFNQQIVMRIKLYTEGLKDEAGNMIYPPTPPDKIPSLEEIRAQILEENLKHDGKISIVKNDGGINLVKLP